MYTTQDIQEVADSEGFDLEYFTPEVQRMLMNKSQECYNKIINHTTMSFSNLVDNDRNHANLYDMLCDHLSSNFDDTDNFELMLTFMKRDLLGLIVAEHYNSHFLEEEE